ncbi:MULTISPECIES: RagB/SusD family nutrient uptake outer membrane protein [Sphingobacterium]|uniref:RagB/SusD family nutrient uptake outer membrane protein n=1 Tax=Sphingobacterium TaxID=28453 RepID=UPI000E97C31F|nr:MULTISPECIES: RagB/SusD family nutrient uptake outer membrane protein [Sphingobacterium]HBI86568.1 RagB/SusD family nutrient uptake outer membrane protein [Sphingobacterium sp.]
MTTIFKVGTKSLVRNLLSLSILLGSFAVSSCNDEKFLEEKVYQLTTGTAYETPDQINMAIGYLHNRMQYLSFGRGPAYDNLFTGSGLDGFARVGDESYITSDWSQMTSVNAFTQHWADNFSQMINYSNTIIEACDNSTVKFTSDEQKNTFRAEAIFFRAFAHRCLAGMFGDWAIITEVAKEAKTDYIRHPRLEVWKQCKDDLEFAVKYLPIKTSESGRIVRAAADHLLAEIYISLGDHSDQKEYYAEAIKAASRIIDGTDGSYRLMTERFGSRQAETGKNVYWDLFRAGNFNYQGGNLEAIWVVQYDYNKALAGTGGAPSSQNSNRLLLEQQFLPNWYYLNRMETDAQGNRNYIFGKGAVTFPNGSSSENGNDLTGYAEWNTRNRPTNYFFYDIWNRSGKEDIRNAEVNIQRQMRQAGGELWATVFNDLRRQGKGNLIAATDTIHHVYPRVWKFSSDQHINGDPKLYDADIYLFRLPETYFLRAEAYLKQGNTQLAARDLNIVRSRSQARAVEPAEVNMDYILDERMRELFGEEFRLVTLSRLSSKENPVLVNRVKKYGWKFPNLSAGRPNIQDFQWIYPVPETIISANTGAVYTQNEGY